MSIATDWGYGLAEQWLAAAEACGATCGNKQIVPWGWQGPGGCTGGAACECALSVSVLEGITRTGVGKCSFAMSGTIRLDLDVCKPNTDMTPAATAGLVRDQATLRWQILQGLHKWAREGKINAHVNDPIQGVSTCPDFTFGTWVLADGNFGTCFRYRLESRLSQVM